jgi:hypothetical protein
VRRRDASHDPLLFVGMLQRPGHYLDHQPGGEPRGDSVFCLVRGRLLRDLVPVLIRRRLPGFLGGGGVVPVVGVTFDGIARDRLRGIQV